MSIIFGLNFPEANFMVCFIRDRKFKTSHFVLGLPVMLFI